MGKTKLITIDYDEYLILVKCKEGSLWLCEVHPAGKKPMSAEAFANGRGLKSGEKVFVE